MVSSGNFIVLSALLTTVLGATGCTNTAGQAGECISTGSCRNYGGRSDPANLCPGGNDIQCCTYGTCVSYGSNGQCIPTAPCKAGGGVSNSARLCPGGTDIQCCTPTQCTNSQGVAGQCVGTGQCRASGGSSDPGNFCPGGSDIQCCTPVACRNSQGVSGTCIGTAQCRNTGGVSDSGNFCPGGSDIQCCTKGSNGTPPPNPPPPQGCGIPNVNAATISLLKQYEGSNVCHKTVYNDPGGGYQTIGYGHKCVQTNCAEVTYPIPLSDADCDALLHSDAGPKQTCVANAFPNNIRLNENQYGALVSFVFNLGCGYATGASQNNIFPRIKAGENPSTVITQEFPAFNKAGGTTQPGLTKRRQSEIDLANTATNVYVIPYTPC